MMREVSHVWSSMYGMYLNSVSVFLLLSVYFILFSKNIII